MEIRKKSIIYVVFISVVFSSCLIHEKRPETRRQESHGRESVEKLSDLKESPPKEKKGEGIDSNLENYLGGDCGYFVLLDYYDLRDICTEYIDNYEICREGLLLFKEEYAGINCTDSKELEIDNSPKMINEERIDMLIKKLEEEYLRYKKFQRIEELRRIFNDTGNVA